MTRGQKGCYVYATDAETRAYFAAFAQRDRAEEAFESSPEPRAFEDLPLTVVPRSEAAPFERHVPLYDLAIAAGDFSEAQLAEAEYWIELPDFMRMQPDLFVTRVVGESMNRRIPNGSWCLFRANPGGSRQGKIVLVQHRAIEDPDHGGSFTIKQYHSEKVEHYGELINQRVVLKPLTNAFGYQNLVLDDELEDLRVIGEFLSVL